MSPSQAPVFTTNYQRVRVLLLKIFIMVQAFEKLHTISAEGLEWNIVQHEGGSFLQAGENQFASFWTRDFCWSVPGLLCLGKTEVVKNHVTYLLDSLHVEKNTVPRLLDFGSGKMRVVAHTVGRSLGLPVLLSLMKKGSTLTPEYYGEHSTSAVDGNLLTLIASAQYILHSGDNVWLIQNSQKLQDCYRHYANLLDEEGLIVQPAFSDWQDSLSREGRT
ncbi:hypothetical protein KBB89_01735, partial [Candidatus Gracilibacteria bacterium]|nr:hypothetical protein [Candidatus Gracilibacteria bacterium]